MNKSLSRYLGFPLNFERCLSIRCLFMHGDFYTRIFNIYFVYWPFIFIWYQKYTAMYCFFFTVWFFDTYLNMLWTATLVIIAALHVEVSNILKKKFTWNYKTDIGSILFLGVKYLQATISCSRIKILYCANFVHSRWLLWTRNLLT